MKGKGFRPSQIIIVAAVTVAVTVFALDFYGFLRHPRAPERNEVTVFHAITLAAGESLKLTIKPSPHRVACRDGYATVVSRTPTGGELTSILVDTSNRGVRCGQVDSGG